MARQKMATRMKIMRLLQEMRGLAQITNRRPSPRSAAALAIQVRPLSVRGRKNERKRTIRVDMQSPPDIPHPVKITHVTEPALPVVLARAP